MTFRPLRAYRDISRDLTELKAAQAAAEEEARFTLARSATQFSQRSRDVVDQTMNLSAVLMRAGEVSEANRLLAEVNREVEIERAALIETVNEVKVEGAIRKEKMTRLRLMKMLVSSILGASMMVFSVFGVALASYLAPDRAQGSETVRSAVAAAAHRNHRSQEDERRGARLRSFTIGDVKLSMTASQLRTFKQLTADNDAPQLEAFLRGLLPAGLARRVAALATGAKDAATTAAKGSTRTVSGAASSSKTFAKQATASGASNDDGSTQTTSEKRGDDEGPSGSGADDQSGTEGCGPEGGDDQGEASFVSPGGCIPVIDKQSPIG